MAFNTVSNSTLADELEVIDAIYGPGTIRLTSSDPIRTFIELRLPGDMHAYIINFPAVYPDQAPSVIGVDSLQLSLRPTVNEGITCLRISFLLAYSPGQVCLFDVIDRYAELSKMRQRLDGRQVAERNDKAVVEFDEQMKALAERVLASLIHLRDTARIPTDQVALLASQIVECAVCLEPVFRHYAANLSCKHSFCVECLQQGLGSMMAGSGEFKCCGNFIPTLIVRQFGNLGPDELLAYSGWLSEASSSNPLYCAQKTCSAFIPSYLVRDALARCMKCKAVTCYTCRGKQHVGVCGYELKKIKNIAKSNRWKFCPCCSHLVERTVGCDHMVCVCGTRFCYRCGQRQDECTC